MKKTMRNLIVALSLALAFTFAVNVHAEEAVKAVIDPITGKEVKEFSFSLDTLEIDEDVDTCAPEYSEEYEDYYIPYDTDKVLREAGLWDDGVFTLVYTDGTTRDFAYNNDKEGFYDTDGHRFNYGMESYQGYIDEWKLEEGQTKKELPVDLSYMIPSGDNDNDIVDSGLSCRITYLLTARKVTSIGLNPTSIMLAENIDGDTEYPSNTDVFYYDYVNGGPIGKGIYSTGTTLAVQDAGGLLYIYSYESDAGFFRSTDGESWLPYDNLMVDNESPDPTKKNPWKAGNTYKGSLSYKGQKAYFDIDIVSVSNYRFKKGNATYKILSSTNRTCSLVSAANTATVTVPASVAGPDQNFNRFNVVQVESKAFTGSAIKTVILGANVKKLQSGAFTSSKATSITAKTKHLTKAGVKGSLKNSKVAKVLVNVGTKKLNKKYVTKYKKFFTKANAGKKAAVK